MKRTAVYILGLCLLALPVAAGNDGGTTSPFSLGAGSRDLALGGANIAGSSGYTAPFWNPARLAGVERFQVGGLHSRLYDSDVAYQYFGLAAPTLDWGGFALGVFRLGIDGIEERDGGNLLLGQIEDNRLGFLFAYGRKISGYDLGAAIVMEHHSLGDYNATSSPGLNLAVQRSFQPGWSTVKGISLVVMGRNVIRPSYKLVDEDTDYPTAFTGSFTVNLIPNASWDQSAALSAAVTKIDGADVRLAAGLEYSFYDLLFLRGGVRDSRLSFGAGLSYRSIGFDYALVDRDMGSLHMFSLTTSFGAPVSERRRTRAADREAAFNGLMTDRLTAQNRSNVTSLMNEGKSSFDSGDLLQAVNYFDRALFLSRSASLDTTEICDLLAEAESSVEDLNRKRRYREYLDSAEVKFEANDYLAAEYFAGLALVEIPGSVQAQKLSDQANTAMSQSASREETIQSRLLVIDSMLSYGKYEPALAVARSLEQLAPADGRVKQALKKATFERMRASASGAFGRTEYKRALTIIDSALTLFPGHQWCLDLKEQAAFALEQQAVEARAAQPEPPKTLSPEMRQEIELTYRRAQKDFEAGKLGAAIQGWERVERLMPDYQSVREYLISAYKFVGVELYSKNQLIEAVAVWKKARRLDPENREIGSYIERTETEMRKLQELTYEHE